MIKTLKKLLAWCWTGCIISLTLWEAAHLPNEAPAWKAFGFMALTTVTLWQVKCRLKE